MAKNRSGYSILKERYAELEKENKRLRILIAEREGVIDKQMRTITDLNFQIGESEGKNLALSAKYEVLVNELFDHMGWFRRLLWEIKHTKED